MKHLAALAVIASLLLPRCTPKENDNDPKQLAAVDSVQRKAHYEKDAALLGIIMADSFYVASKGKISRSTKQKMISRFAEYFKETAYSYWENVDTPLVERSGDLAVATYHKKTISTSPRSSAIDTALFAWASVMKKINGRWKITGIITTDNQ